MTDTKRTRPGAPAPSMQDVADRAGVSLGTVSNTINSPEKVREPTRARVHQAIEELGFVRNDAARHLAVGTSTTIGLILVDMANSFFVDIARGAEAAVRARGMNLLIANSDVDDEKQASYFGVFKQARVAGILLAPTDSPAAVSASTRASGTPLVLVNYASRDGSFSGVVADERLGGYLAAKHLIDLGRHNLAFVGGPSWLLAVRERLDGARWAASEASGVTLTLVETTGQNARHGRRAAAAIIAGNHGPVNGIVAASDLIAVGCIDVLDRNPSHRVPSDVAVIGYDNNHFASESATPVSTIGQPGEQMGRVAADLLLDEIEAGSTSTPKKTVVLQPHLIARRSTIGYDEPSEP